MNNIKHSISEKIIAAMIWIDIEVYLPAVLAEPLLIAGIQVLYCHSFWLAPGEAPF